MTGDFDRDGRLDLAVTMWQNSNVGIQLGNGDGTFQGQIEYSTGSNNRPNTLVINDFNGDNYLDLVVTNSVVDGISILFGNGDGTFQEPMAFAAGPRLGAYSIAIDDFNHDHYLDIAIAGEYQTYPSILLNDGNQTFNQQTTFFGQQYSQIRSIVAGDFNNDNITDLALVNQIVSNLNLGFGLGNGTFDNYIQFSVGIISDCRSISIGDFNCDKQLDIIIANRGTHSLGVLLGNGDGTFQEEQLLSTGPSSRPNSVIVHDFNNDGYPDVAFADSNNYNVGLFLGTGRGTFLNQTTFPLEDYPTESIIDAGDFNNDGKLDFVVVDPAKNSPDILLNTCN